MIHSNDLNEANVLLYAAKHYNNPQCFDTIEFYEDLSRFKYLKRLFGRYEEEGDLKERLILNHLIVIYNVFDVEAATRLLFLKLDEYLEYLSPFLEYLGYLPDIVSSINGVNYFTYEIYKDNNIAQLLEQL